MCIRHKNCNSTIIDIKNGPKIQPILGVRMDQIKLVGFEFINQGNGRKSLVCGKCNTELSASNIQVQCERCGKWLDGNQIMLYNEHLLCNECIEHYNIPTSNCSIGISLSV